jgi:hypothetical protein
MKTLLSFLTISDRGNGGVRAMYPLTHDRKGFDCCVEALNSYLR